MCVCVNPFTLTPRWSDMQATTTIYIRVRTGRVYHFLKWIRASPRPAVAALSGLFLISFPPGADLVPDESFLPRQQRGEWMSFARVAASLASRSAASFPGTSKCSDIHWRRMTTPCSLVFVAARMMAWVTYCPDLFPGFWIACSADMLSLRMVADVSWAWVNFGTCRTILVTMLMAYRTPIGSAACTDLDL